jgi:DNA-binding transcriptional regulator YiaG
MSENNNEFLQKILTTSYMPTIKDLEENMRMELHAPILRIYRAYVKAKTLPSPSEIGYEIKRIRTATNLEMIVIAKHFGITLNFKEPV